MYSSRAMVANGLRRSSSDVSKSSPSQFKWSRSNSLPDVTAIDEGSAYFGYRPLRNLKLLTWNDRFAKKVNSLEKTRLHVAQTDILEKMISEIRVDSFDYQRKQEDRLLGRKALLQLTSILLTMLRNSYGDKRHLFANLIFHVIQRFEFDLLHVQKKLLFPELEDKYQTTTIDQLRLHEVILIDLIRYVIVQLQRNVLASSHIELVSKTASIAYFRLPQFQKEFIELCRQQIDDQFLLLLTEEWKIGLYRRYMNSFHHSEMTRRDHRKKMILFEKSNPSLFCWHLISQNDASISSSGQEVSEEFASKMTDQLNEPIVFFSIIEEICRVILTSSHSTVEWNSIPGLRAIFTLALQRYLFLSRDDLNLLAEEYLGGFTSRSPLLSFCMESTLMSTNVHDVDAINTSLNIVDQMLESSYLLVDHPEPLPEDLNFDVLLCSFDILLESDHYQVLIKTLCLLYTHLGCFHGSHRSQLVKDRLINKYFDKFFLHWNQQVREAYHCILIFRVNRIGLYRPIPEQTPVVPRTRRRFWSIFKSAFRGNDSSPSPEPLASKPLFEGNDSRAAISLLSAPETSIITHDLNHDDEVQDQILESTYLLHVRDLKTKLKEGSIHQSSRIYAKLSLDEYDSTVDLYKRLQTPNLKKYQIAGPKLYFQILNIMSGFV